MNSKWELFQKFLITQEEQVQLGDFVINALIVILLSWLLGLTYIKCGRSLSNRKSFASNFILVGIATMLIISIVKSSLALSLGLVGALSIIRFRAAIKEPEELSFLFIVIAMGVGLGANLRLIVITAFIIIVGLVWLRYFLSKPDYSNNLFLTVNDTAQKLSLSQLEELLHKYFSKYQLKRYDETDAGLEATFLLPEMKTNALEQFKKDLKEISPDIKFSFIDNKML